MALKNVRAEGGQVLFAGVWITPDQADALAGHVLAAARAARAQVAAAAGAERDRAAAEMGRLRARVSELEALAQGNSHGRDSDNAGR